MIDARQINSFRSWINRNDWAFYKYVNDGNKNKWNCICSAMDWIDVSIKYIIEHPLKTIRDDNSIELFSYIACVQIVVEAVEQLNRVINKTAKRVFEKDKKCFTDNPFGQTDREFFETIRACFGAHPVNLKEPEDPKNKKVRRFASWSAGSVGLGDYCVILYSNIVGEKDIILGIKYDQIEAFLEKYYGYLSVLQSKLQQQFDSFCKKKKKEKIPKNNDPVQQLMILQSESRSRLNNGYYNSAIEELLLVFQTPITCLENRALVNCYREARRGEIDELYRNLQNMIFCDLSSDSRSYEALPLRSGWTYWFSKLDQVRQGNSFPKKVCLDKIQEIFDGYFVFEYATVQELFLLVCATLNKLSLSDK